LDGPETVGLLALTVFDGQAPAWHLLVTDLRVKAELALAQNKRTAHCIYRVEEHFSRTTDFINILVNTYLCVEDNNYVRGNCGAAL
jgi:hypothetical protein